MNKKNPSILQNAWVSAFYKQIILQKPSIAFTNVSVAFGKRLRNFETSLKDF